jgi:hypothetical protein
MRSLALPSSDACVASVGAGCGTHNEDAVYLTGDTHTAGANREYQFVIQHAGARAGAVYYFRAYDLLNNVPVVASSTYPSLVAASAELVFSTIGVPSGTSTEGIVTDVATASSSISFGTVPFNTQYEAAYRLNVNTNATEGYQLFMIADQAMQNDYGEPIPNIAGTNISPVAPLTGCAGLPACFAYHVGDDSLSNAFGDQARFSPNDTYAAISTTTLEEVAYSSIPSNDIHDIVYRFVVSEDQPAGEYGTGITLIAVPVY